MVSLRNKNANLVAYPLLSRFQFFYNLVLSINLLKIADIMQKSIRGCGQQSSWDNDIPIPFKIKSISIHIPGKVLRKNIRYGMLLIHNTNIDIKNKSKVCTNR